MFLRWPSGGRCFRLPAPRCRILALLACCQILGCGGGSDGYNVSGTVLFDGKPVPLGKIYFTPDAAKDNSGPSGFADIKDGEFDTKKTGKAAPAGPVVVRIEGFMEVPPVGEVTTKPLFYPYQVTADLPRHNSTQTFTVPASATKPPAETQIVQP
ncbi:MAG TPA: hypothetical protein VH575_33585 [Gemmataceae bacterium]|jgi:hypothetical protein